MKRNCLFILVDCLRADKCWGESKTAKTPNIDLLCRRGTTFTQAIAATTTTKPAVASILTGSYPFAHGIRSLYGYKLKSRIKTLAEVFGQNGYHTYAEVTGPLIPQTGINKGFDNYHLRDKSDNICSPWYRDLLTRFARKQFEEPYFVFLHFFELHQPRFIAKEYNNSNYGKNRYERALSSLDASLGELLRHIDDDTIILLHADHGEKIAETMLEEYITLLTNYLSILKAKLGFRGKNRLKLLGHGFHVYDYLIRVPLVFVGNSVFPENRRISEQVRQIDVAPTIVEALKLKHPSNGMSKVYLSSETCGRSLLPLINNQPWEEVSAYCEIKGVAFGDMSEWLTAIRTPKYKYICKPCSDYPWEEFYDLENDPQEKRNLIVNAPEVAQKLRNELRKILRDSEKGQIRERIVKLKGCVRLW